MLLFLTLSALVLSVAAQREVTNTLTVTNGANAGKYFKDEFCPAGTFAAGFQLLCQEDRGTLGDNTAVNGMTLFCEPPHAPSDGTNHGVIESYYGPWGYWREVFHCPDAMFLSQFMLRVQKDGGITPDDAGVTNVRFNCQDYDSSDKEEITADGENPGKWGDYSDSCPVGEAICGMATEFKTPIIGDNTAATDFTFYCCAI